MSVKSALLGAAAALSVFASGAQAAVITFEGAPADELSGTYVEDGFRYGEASGHLYGNIYGNPGRDIEGLVANEGGVLFISSEDSPLFTFDALDYWAFNSNGQGSQTLLVNGWRDGVLLGSDSFELANNGGVSWTLFGATELAGKKLDKLTIGLDAGNFYWQGVDNVRLTAVSAIPEPATWAMMITGFGMAGAMLRRRRAGVAA